MSATLFVIPCGRAKLSQPSPARSLYTGRMFRYCLTVIEEEAELAAAAGRSAVRILSARYGLLAPDTRIEPYDQTMTDRDAVPATVVADQLTPLTEAGYTDIHAFLPRSYLTKLQGVRAVLDQRGHHTLVHDHYLGTRGIGDQRHILATLCSTRGTDDPRTP